MNWDEMGKETRGLMGLETGRHRSLGMPRVGQRLQDETFNSELIRLSSSGEAGSPCRSS
jgi:hypothetical protein